MMSFTRRIRSAVAPGVVLLGVLMSLALVAGATEIVDVRVGKHPTFTRVVFELDAPAGYRIERYSDETGDATSIFVTIDASSQARTLGPRGDLLESVTVEEQLGRAVARIHLRKPHLRLKEMILANPPRIVLDMMHDTPTSSAMLPSAVAGPGVSTEVVTTPTAKATAPGPVVKTPVAQPDLVEKPAPKIGAAPSVPRTMPPTPEMGTTIAAKPILRPKTPAAATPAVRPIPGSAENRVTADLSEEFAATRPDPGALPPRARKPGPVPSTSKSSTAQSKAEKARSRTGGGLPYNIDARLAGGIAAAVLALVAFVFIRRRRAAAADEVDAFSDDDNLFPERREASAGFALSDAATGDPFAEAGQSAGDGGLFGDLDEGVSFGDSTGRPGTTPLAGQGSDLFSDDEKEESSVDQMSTALGGRDPLAGAVAASAGADVARVVAELERRLAHVETRLDETVEANERLERQVAAQSEELRVQRAAIARTQRALRSLSRSEEEQATEPALREPIR